MPSATVVPGGIWFSGPMQQTWPAPKTPCQLTLQPPSWLVIESALGPVTTTLSVVDSGNAWPSFRSRVMDSRVAFRVPDLPVLTAELAALGSTQFAVGSLMHGWSKR